MKQKLYKEKIYMWQRRIFTGLLALCWMLLIGSFSAQTGEQSGGLSGAVAERLLIMEEQLLQKDYTDWQKEKRIEAMQFPIRKLAHMTEYGLLAVILALHFGCYAFGTQNIRARLLLSWVTATLYAASDEIHQLFVDGRSGQFTDVCIDSAGALVGTLFFFGVFIILRRQGKKQRTKSINKID